MVPHRSLDAVQRMACRWVQVVVVLAFISAGGSHLDTVGAGSIPVKVGKRCESRTGFVCLVIFFIYVVWLKNIIFVRNIYTFYVYLVSVARDRVFLWILNEIFFYSIMIHKLVKEIWLNLLLNKTWLVCCGWVFYKFLFYKV